MIRLHLSVSAVKWIVCTDRSRLDCSPVCEPMTGSPQVSPDGLVTSSATLRGGDGFTSVESVKKYFACQEKYFTLALRSPQQHCPS